MFPLRFTAVFRSTLLPFCFARFSSETLQAYECPERPRHTVDVKVDCSIISRLVALPLRDRAHRESVAGPYSPKRVHLTPCTPFKKHIFRYQLSLKPLRSQTSISVITVLHQKNLPTIKQKTSRILFVRFYPIQRAERQTPRGHHLDHHRALFLPLFCRKDVGHTVLLSLKCLWRH
jgi:hypothetical protein